VLAWIRACSGEEKIFSGKLPSKIGESLERWREAISLGAEKATRLLAETAPRLFAQGGAASSRAGSEASQEGRIGKCVYINFGSMLGLTMETTFVA